LTAVPAYGTVFIPTDQILSQSAIFFSHVMIASRSSPLLLHRTRPAINAKVSFNQAAGGRTQDFTSNKRQCQAYDVGFYPPYDFFSSDATF
jgi:hypothetical protein